MSQLEGFLAAGKAADSTASTPDASAPATDVKPNESTPVVDSAASASSVEQAPDPKGSEQVRTEKAGDSKAEETMVPVSALQAERTRRKAAELAAQQQQQPAAPKKNFWDDPEAVIADQVNQVRHESKARFYDLCEERFKETHTDFDDVVNPIMEEAQSDEVLGRQLFELVDAAKDPAKALYQFARNRRELQVAGGDLGKYRESIEKPLRDQLETLKREHAALKAQFENLSKVPTSLSGTPSASRGDLAADQAVQRKPLSEIVKPRKRA